MTGISCRSSDRKKPKKYHKKPKKTEKKPKKPKNTEKNRKKPKKAEKNRTLPQISNLGLVFFGFFRFFSVFFGLQPPPTNIQWNLVLPVIPILLFLFFSLRVTTDSRLMSRVCHVHAVLCRLLPLYPTTNFVLGS